MGNNDTEAIKQIQTEALKLESEGRESEGDDQQSLSVK